MAEQQRVMVVTAHIADWVTRCGGTIAKYTNAGHRVKVFTLSYGQYAESGFRWGEDPTRTVDDVIAIRRQEGDEAAAILGVELTVFGWQDGPLWVTPNNVEALRDEIGGYQPQIILTHPPIDRNHPDHVQTSEAVRAATSYVGMRRHGRYPVLSRGVALYYMEATYGTAPYTGFRPDIYVDIGDVFEQKMRAVQVMTRTQRELFENYGDMARLRGREATLWARGTRGRVQYAEGFMQETPWTTDFLPL